MSEQSIPVGIVGAGPVGLALAARLASFSVSSVILEKSPHLLRKGSKACLIQGDALEVLDKAGCAEAIAAEGIHWRIAHTYIRGVERIRKEYPERVGYSEFINISQYRIEQEVVKFLETCALVDIRWSHEVKSITQHERGVTVGVSHPGGDSELTFDYLVACDGVHSTIRELTGVQWTGYTHTSRFLITDIRALIPVIKERHFHFDPVFNPGRQVVMHPQPDNVWRIDWQLAPDADIEAEQQNGGLDIRIRKVIGDIPYQIEWCSTYRFSQRVVEQFKLGRIFFAGDAAHSLPPYGSRGMNSGIQDADNLAWKLACVLAGTADASLLETYHDERYQAAQENLRVTEATIKFMAPENLLKRWFRNLILKLSGPFKALRKNVNHGKMAEPFTYLASDIVDGESGHGFVGKFAPDMRVFSDKQPTRLRKFFGNQFVVLFFGTMDETLAFAGKFLQLRREFPMKLVVGLPLGMEPDIHIDHCNVFYYDDIASVRAFYATMACWFLVRPDGHIAGRYVLADAEWMEQIVSRAMKRKPRMVASHSEENYQVRSY